MTDPYIKKEYQHESQVMIKISLLKKSDSRSLIHEANVQCHRTHCASVDIDGLKSQRKAALRFLILGGEVKCSVYDFP